MRKSLRVLVVGCGHMGAAHARAYRRLDGFEIAGVVSRGRATRESLSAELGGVAAYDDFRGALDATRPDAVSINTYPDTHAEYAVLALEAGAHVFVEKPLAQTVEAANAVVEAARRAGRKVVVGYILRHHPSWQKFVEIARGLGTPLVMRMNLNQQSSGDKWRTHRQLLSAVSPLVDCGVHYVDMMCLMTCARPVRVQAIGARLTEEIPAESYNYGQLQVVFDDGSVGWYEVGWGPMMSETAYFIKDVIGPKGCASIVDAGTAGSSSDIDAHTRTNRIRIHAGRTAPDGGFAEPDRFLDMSDEPGHQDLCEREQAFFLKAIRDDVDLTAHLRDAVASLRVVLAADESVRTGRPVLL